MSSMPKNEAGTTRILTINQQKLEDWINEQEDTGQFLNAMGVITNEELAAGVHQLEDFRVKVEADTSFADKEEAKLEKGQAPLQVG